MANAASILISFVAVLHLYFLVLEMFLWTTPTGMRIFRTTPEFALQSKSLAANQGLYNGFLAIGLLWGLRLGESGDPIKLFFLGCIIVAGIFGAATVNRRILYLQAVPAAIAVIVLLYSRQ